MTPDAINELIDECIDDLCDDDVNRGAESLTELAHLWAQSGLGQSSFENTRHFIINNALERLGTQATPFINLKLQAAEQGLRERRNTSGRH
jgi:hypothetical protein